MDETPAVVELSGDLGIETYDLVRAALDGARDAHTALIDLSKVNHIDSSTLHQLTLLDGHFRARGRQLAFVVTSENVWKLLTITGLSRRLHCFSDVEAAFKFLSGDMPAHA